MAKKKEEKQKFGDIVQNHELVKRTLMVSAFPALIKQQEKNGKTYFQGFLPGFEFAQVEDIVDENECVELLQDLLDDEVEELIVFGKSLPNVDEDDVLNEKYPDHKIVYLDINVYATPEELDYYDACTHDCSCCDHGCDCGEEEFDCEDDCCDDDCCDDECGEHHCDCEEHHCNCGCEDEEEKHSCNNHQHNHKCNCGEHKNKKDNKNN